MTTDLPAINARQAKVAALLASGSTVLAASQEAGVCEKSVYLWMKQEAFRSFVADCRARCLEEALGRLASIAARAASTLGELLDSQSEHVRLKAASEILSRLIRTREHVELAMRIEELERRSADGPRFGVAPQSA